MGELIKEAFGVLATWPLVQGSVAILVLVIAALLAWTAIRKEMPKQEGAPPAPQASVPVQIESPWLVQQLVEMHLTIENIKSGVDAANAKADTNAASLGSIAQLLRRRWSRAAKRES